MGWIIPITVTPVVIIPSGTPGSGLFVYSGTPSVLGNLVTQIVAPGVTKDPFGNAVSAVLNVGKWSAAGALLQHFGVDQNGKLYLADTTGLTRIFADPAIAALTVYNTSGAGPGNLVESIASVAVGNEGFGNAVQAGFTAYGTGLFAQLQAAALSWGGTGITAAPVIGSGSAAQIQLSSGQTAGNTVEAILSLNTAATGAVSTALLGPGVLEITESAVPAADGSVSAGPKLFGTTGGHYGVVADSLHGDGQTYRVERIRQSTTSTQQFTLASAVAITGLSRTLGVGTYHVRLKVFWVPSGVVASTHVHNFAFTGTATGNVNGQCWQAQAASAVQQTALNAGAGNNLTASLTSPAHVAFAGWTELDADITVTVAGTLTHTITLTTAGDDVTTSAGTYWEITPES